MICESHTQRHNGGPGSGDGFAWVANSGDTKAPFTEKWGENRKLGRLMSSQSNTHEQEGCGFERRLPYQLEYAFRTWFSPRFDCYPKSADSMGLSNLFDGHNTTPWPDMKLLGVALVMVLAIHNGWNGRRTDFVIGFYTTPAPKETQRNDLRGPNNAVQLFQATFLRDCADTTS
ncbi:hypothetical protein Zmor_010676 [Zophobas morio]|uniref:Uncharacterized protein n=1 Tax=Zophobas morio TaxID=2755281 RepID=A0AA38ITA5_9CUCU|nr:hypothetical protein Zmor_010676 [Zophobas morio]